MALTRRLVGWLLVFDDSQGFVDVVEFERESDARLAYRDLQHPMVRDAARGLTEANTCSLLGCGSCRILPVRRRQVCRVARALVGVLPRRGELTGGAGTRLSAGVVRPGLRLAAVPMARSCVVGVTRAMACSFWLMSACR
jgi:hypothetical protein